MWREQTYLHPRALLGYFPCNSDGNELIVWDPDAPRRPRELERLVFPRQPRHDRICLADFYRPLIGYRRQVDVVALQAVTAGDEVTELMARLEADGEFAEQLFVHGLGVQTAEGMAEWLHSRVRADLGIDARRRAAATRGAIRACPEQSEHEKVFGLLDAPSIGLRLSGGFAVEPEQSTLAIVAHHPAGRVLRDEVGLPAEDAPSRPPTSCIAGEPTRPDAAVRAQRRGAGARTTDGAKQARRLIAGSDAPEAAGRAQRASRRWPRRSSPR